MALHNAGPLLVLLLVPVKPGEGSCDALVLVVDHVHFVSKAVGRLTQQLPARPFLTPGEEEEEDKKNQKK